MANSPRKHGRAGRGTVLAGALLAASMLGGSMLAAPSPAAAEDPSADELAVEAVDKLLKALDLLMGSIPQYEAPYINENGDIIIKRKHHGDEPLPTPEEKPAPRGGADTTTT